MTDSTKGIESINFLGKTVAVESEARTEGRYYTPLIVFPGHFDARSMKKLSIFLGSKEHFEMIEDSFWDRESFLLQGFNERGLDIERLNYPYIGQRHHTDYQLVVTNSKGEGEKYHGIAWRDVGEGNPLPADELAKRATVALKEIFFWEERIQTPKR